MDNRRFDALSRFIGEPQTRRSVGTTVAGILAGFVAALGGHGDAEAREQRKRKQQMPGSKKKKKPKCLKTGTRCTRQSGGKDDNCRKCCTGYATRRPGGGGRCACKPEGDRCTADKQCCNRECTGGVCGPCEPGQTLCVSGCVDLLTDDDHCGTCGNTCGANQGCCGGVCTDLTQLGTCGACDVSCDADDGCCGQVCAELTTTQNCGSCGNDCGVDEDCCRGACTNLTTDANCAACGIACPSGQGCRDGACVDLVCGNGGTCLVFVTSTLQTAALGGLAGADAICQQLATAAELPGTYLAWLSSTSVSVYERLTRNPGPYELVTGTVVATSWTDLTDRSLLAPINRDEQGTTREAEVWTNTAPEGGISGGGACSSWTVASSATGFVGLSTSTSRTWTDAYGQFCHRSSGLYCFQQS